ncbi:hypothetical protein Egran_02215 [Elaphomyces granulatus]|uniref:NACHT domain-containing protein n=1 Tax=Elaphomyces granulatus TaxID=519963 RepID=A0A232M0U4_9EURO|nr:hypothetical protein Egran_02215 [Elaphomyces granulatus]
MFYEKFTFKDSQIICIFETKETATVEWSHKTHAWERTGRAIMMVPRTSTTHAGKFEKSYDQLSIDADHSDLVKFSNPANPDYLIIKSRIKRLVDDAPTVIKKRVADHRKVLSDTEAKYVKALDAPDYVSFRKHRVDEPADGTFQWFLHDKLVCPWLSEDKPSFLWVRGAPGQGKTVLSKFLLNHLESRLPNPQHTVVIYFFFYDQDERFQTVNSLLRSLIKQLLIVPDLSGYIAEVFEIDLPTESEDDLWEILEMIIRAPVFRTIFCVLDALDECKHEESRKRFLRKFTRLLQTPSRQRFPVLKLLVTSRPTVDISRELSPFPCIDLKANPDDLKIFIDSKVTALNHLSADLQKIAVGLLLSRAERTFLWASIVLKELKIMILPSPAKLRDTINEIPTVLDELYRSIINRIMEGTPEEQKLLRSTDEHTINLTAEAVTSTAGVILEVTDDKVHLIHQSAKDFLLKNQQLRSAKFCNGLDPNIYLAKVCMIYLSFEDFETGPCGNREKLAARKRQYPLFYYAARNWHTHIQGQHDIGDISNLICRLIESGSPVLRSWGEAAEIQDLHEATDTWWVATKTNIPWLAEFQLSDTTIDEDRVKEVAKNGMAGYNIMEMFARRGDVRFTEAAVQA